MIELLRLILHIMASLFKPRTKLVAEILVLRQQYEAILSRKGNNVATTPLKALGAFFFLRDNGRIDLRCNGL